MALWMLVVIAAAAVILVVAAMSVWMAKRKQRRTERLQTQFGTEYDRTVDVTGGRKAAEADLTQRQERVSKLELRPISESEKSAFTTRWQATQARFVDEPGGAVTDADSLVSELMQARGYPVGDFEQRAADVSVDHPQVVSNYRAAHTIAVSHSRASASTEDLRQAMVHYRALFTDLLETAEDSPTSERAVPQPAGATR